MNGVILIIKKELTRVFRDRKLIFSLFILPVVMIAVIYSLMGRMTSNMINDIDSHIPNIYIQNAPEGFFDFTKVCNINANFNGVDSEFDTSEIKDGILNGSIDLLVVFEDGFLDKVKEYKEGGYIPEVKTYYNPSEDYSSQGRRTFLDMVLDPYKAELLKQRVGNLDNLTVFTIDTSNQEESSIMNEEKAAGKALSMMLPFMLVMLLFVGAMSLGVDAITGEKERGTLSSMLITPLKRSEIVAGKIIAITILSCLSAAAYAVSIVISVPSMLHSPAGEGTLSFSFSIIQVLQLLAIMLGLVFLYVNMVSLMAVFARTTKEANAYVSPLYILVIMGGVLSMFQNNANHPLLMYMVPVYGSALSIQTLLVGELTAAQLILSLCGTVGLGVILTSVISKAFNSEKVMFNA